MPSLIGAGVLAAVFVLVALALSSSPDGPRLPALVLGADLIRGNGTVVTVGIMLLSGALVTVLARIIR